MRAFCQMRGDSRTYSSSTSFETFPFPQGSPHYTNPELDEAGDAYHAARTNYLNRHEIGMTKFYNRMNERHHSSPEIEELRHLHVALDIAVLAAYGWSDIKVPSYLDTQHDKGLAKTAYGKELIDRLLSLNAKMSGPGHNVTPPAPSSPSTPKRRKRYA